MISFSTIFGDLKRHARARFDLYQREKPNDILLITTGIQFALMVIMLVALPLDSRLVSGVNPWIKPIKFTQSIAAYVLTLAWLLDYLRISRWGKQILSWGASICVLTQMGCITLQAARGTTSHFNMSSPFDKTISILMDVMDPVGSIFMIALLVLACRGKFAVSRPVQWGIVSGLVIFLWASAIGAIMVVQGSHSVGGGAGDDGAGLPILNWSTTGGDLRPAHFLGLHALQILPIIGWLLNLWGGLSMRVKLAGVVATALGVAALITFLFYQAMHGIPFVRV